MLLKGHTLIFSLSATFGVPQDLLLDQACPTFSVLLATFT